MLRATHLLKRPSNPGRVVPGSPDLEEPEEEEAGCGAWRSWLRGASAAEAEPSGKRSKGARKEAPGAVRVGATQESACGQPAGFIHSHSISGHSREAPGEVVIRL